jgi:multisubunit Na+/H+ antiporter MnhG subunit
MIFDYFYKWNEERTGLIGGVCFVLVGLFIYLSYLLNSSLIYLLTLILIVIFTALTAFFFQLPRIKNYKPGISTFIGGVTWGISFIIWGYSIYLLIPNSLEFLTEGASIPLALLITSFFAFGFLFIAAIEPYKESKAITKKIKGKKKGIKEFKTDEEFIDRL